MTRRAWFHLGLWSLRALIGLLVIVPGASYLLTPLRARKAPAGPAGFVPVARLRDLTPGVPRAFPVSIARQDAWVRYPPEPVGTVWLIRQEGEADRPVRALSAECPHLACQIKLTPDSRNFVCPCHNSRFGLDGERENKISPRDMDELEVARLDPDDPDSVVSVRFERFRTMTSERIPLG